MPKNDKSNLGPDRMCEKYASTTSKITLRLLDSNTILVESDKRGLEFLGNLLICVSQTVGEGFQLSPDGPGSALFSRESGIGLYIHRSDGLTKAPSP